MTRRIHEEVVSKVLVSLEYCKAGNSEAIMREIVKFCPELTLGSVRNASRSNAELTNKVKARARDNAMVTAINTKRFI